LGLIWVAAQLVQPQILKVSEIGFELIGRSVATQGQIVYKREHPAGHLFLTISDGESRIQVPLFVSLVDALQETGLSEDELEVGVMVWVTGLVDEYKGSLQILPRKAGDIIILSE
jgi:DNA/RNA endonuclease YhcR with UshA esterase domain